jgi:hypothetical protein
MGCEVAGLEFLWVGVPPLASGGYSLNQLPDSGTRPPKGCLKAKGGTPTQGERNMIDNRLSM